MSILLDMKNSIKVLQKVKNQTTLKSGIPRHGIYLKQMKSICRRDIHTFMFTDSQEMDIT